MIAINQISEGIAHADAATLTGKQTGPSGAAALLNCCVFMRHSKTDAACSTSSLDASPSKAATNNSLIVAMRS